MITSVKFFKRRVQATNLSGVRVCVLICFKMQGSMCFAFKWLLGIIDSPPWELLFDSSWGCVGFAGFGKDLRQKFVTKSLL